MGPALCKVGPITIRLTAVIWLALLVGVSGEARKSKRAGVPAKRVTDEARLELLRRAAVWTTPPRNASLRLGPQGPEAFQPHELVTCDYVEGKRSGASPKFNCALAEGDVVKVKYGSGGEVEAEVLATRLLWALGFPADRMYPVRVRCRGCSINPWEDQRPASGEHDFSPAVIERKFPGREIKSHDHEGWAWPELDLLDERQGGATIAQRDALRLLAVFIQHTDSKPEQQRLLCPPLPAGTTADCAAPIMMLNDVGQTFGKANTFNRDRVSSASFEQWAKTPIWKGDTGCVGLLPRSNTGTLENPIIGEEGRAFLAGLLAQLTDAQLRDLLEVARLDLRSRRPGSDKPPASIDDWVMAFKYKRDQIVYRRCSERRPS